MDSNCYPLFQISPMINFCNQNQNYINKMCGGVGKSLFCSLKYFFYKEGNRIYNTKLLYTQSRKQIKGCTMNIWDSLFHLFINLSFCEQMRSLKTLMFIFINPIFTIKIDSNLYYLILTSWYWEQSSQRKVTLQRLRTSFTIFAT